ncbi:MAG: hypothetical protein IPH38_17865 [Candidatus Microthrix sp.]|nr:hypothetical protein [Candidatus Microthrix sp.]MBK7021400.1 hypothetical protein [Candidatus Microthrix sp.]
MAGDPDLLVVNETGKHGVLAGSIRQHLVDDKAHIAGLVLDVGAIDPARGAGIGQREVGHGDDITRRNPRCG